MGFLVGIWTERTFNGPHHCTSVPPLRRCPLPCCPWCLAALKGGFVSTCGSMSSTQQRDPANVITAVVYRGSVPGAKRLESFKKNIYIYIYIYNRARFKLNFNSKHRLKDSGVPQGSSLDPLPFRLDLLCFGYVNCTCRYFWVVFFVCFSSFHNFTSLYPCQWFRPFPAS